MILRQFNNDGIDAFKSFLADCRANPEKPVTHGLLEDEALTVRVKPLIQVARQHFARRRDAAEYLTTILGDLPGDEVAQNAGLWTWLSLSYFDEVCPAQDGQRDVKNDYYYVFEPRNVRHFYRHLLFVAWHAARVALPFDRLFLDTSLSSLDKVTSEVMKKLFLTRIPCIFEVLDRLYWDEDRGRSRRGIVDTRTVKPGDLVHRLPIRIRQLEKTYDLFSLTADQLLDLLGDEFNIVDNAVAKA